MQILQLPSDIAADLESRNLQILTADSVDGFLTKADEVSVPSWPEFMLHDHVSDKYWAAMTRKHAEFQFCLVDKQSKRWVAVGNSIPIHWTGSFDELPDDGWDWALESGMEIEIHNMVSAIAIQIHPEFRGQKLSTLMIRIMRAIAANHGYKYLVAPVRPNHKHLYPKMPIEEYVAWRKDGLPVDPWLRVHERLGAKIIKICPKAMLISGSVREWEKWTGLKFPQSGEYVVEGALVPVNVDVEEDIGAYVEPNVWMVHETNAK